MDQIFDEYGEYILEIVATAGFIVILVLAKTNVVSDFIAKVMDTIY